MTILSAKKRKHIKRLATNHSPQEIAEKFDISIQQAEQVIQESNKAVRQEKTFDVLNTLIDYCLILIPFIAPLIVLKHSFDFANLPQSAFIQTGVGFLCLLGFIKGYRDKQISIRKSPISLPMLCFLIWALLSLIPAHNRFEGIVIWLSWAAAFLMYIRVQQTLKDESNIFRLLSVIYISGVIVASIGISQHLFQWDQIPQSVAPAATFANKNMAVHFVVLVLPLGWMFFLASRQTLSIGLLSVSSAWILTYLIYTQTRAGWLAFGVEAILLGLFMMRDYRISKQINGWNRNKSTALIFGIILTVFLINLGPDGFRWRVDDIFFRAATIAHHEDVETKESDTSISLRLAIWRNTLEMIKDRFFFGLGLGNHKIHYPLYHRKVVTEEIFGERFQLSNVHNDYLQIFSELGIIGMAILGWMAFHFFRMAMRLCLYEKIDEHEHVDRVSDSVPRRLSQPIRFLTMALVTGIIGLLVNAGFCFPFQRAIPPFILMIYLGILAYIYERDHQATFSLSAGMGGVLILASLIIWVGLIVFHYREIRYDHHYFNVLNAEKMQRWDRVITEGNIANASNPFRKKVLSHVGRAYLEIGKHDQAIEPIKKVVESYPNHMNALLNLGVGYNGIGDNANAVAAYQRVLEIKPDFPKAHNNMGNIYMKQDQPEKAVESFKKASELEPENHLILYNLAIAEIQLGHYTSAVEALKKVIAFKPGWDVAHKQLGTLYYNFLNEMDKGVVHLKKAIELNPNIKDADRIRDFIQTYERGNSSHDSLRKR